MSPLAITVFDYPHVPLVRRHGPPGYLDYKHYKPWLRDEFAFRCVYCLCRETWFPDGQVHFGVDHTRPLKETSGQISHYDDLVYACCLCNAYKKDFPAELDFCALASAEHLQFQRDGTFRGLTHWGDTLIEVCALNRPHLVSFRRDMYLLLALLAERQDPAAEALRKRFLGYPDDLPDLAKLRPPAGNSRSEGVAAASFERRRRGELPDRY